MRETIALRTIIPEAWSGGTGIQVYTDFGSGTVDLNRPLLPTPYRVVDDGGRRRSGFGHVPFGRGKFGHGTGGRPRKGFGHTRFGHTPFGATERFFDVPVTIRPTFGPWKFKIAAVDEAGNVQGGAFVEIIRVVSGSEPPSVRSFSFSSYDSINDQMTFEVSLNTE
ncbi:MAG: hypothetical protein AABZ47_15290 [Planctomycetota bacterium]